MDQKNKKDNNNKIKIIDIIKKIKIKHLIILILLLSFNTYAWFVFATKVSMGMDVHVSSWNINFKADDQTVGTELSFDVERAYPGMETYTKTLEVTNVGEVPASIQYEIKKVEMFGETFEVSETVSSSDLLNKIANEYPFKITMQTSSEIISAQNGKATYSVSMIWPLDSGDDEADTLWGERAYTYYATNANTNCIHIDIEVEAVQNNG